MDAEQRSVFQGIVYYYRENMVNCRYQVTLKDAVDGALLQQALDAARAKAPYYFQKPVWEKKLLHLEPSDAPCPVRQGSAKPEFPDENGFTDVYKRQRQRWASREVPSSASLSCCSRSAMRLRRAASGVSFIITGASSDLSQGVQPALQAHASKVTIVCPQNGWIPKRRNFSVLPHSGGACPQACRPEASGQALCGASEVR